MDEGFLIRDFTCKCPNQSCISGIRLGLFIKVFTTMMYLLGWRELQNSIHIWSIHITRIKLWPQILMKSLLNQCFFHKSSISHPSTSAIKRRLWLTSSYCFLLCQILNDSEPKDLGCGGDAADLHFWPPVSVQTTLVLFRWRLLSETAMREVRRHARRLKVPLHSFLLSVAAPTLNT